MQTNDQIVLNSYSLGGRFASPCPLCTKSIVYQQSFALCNCPIFFHTQCFLSHLNQKDIHNQPKVKCLYCQQSYEIEYSIRAQIECKKKLSNTLIISFAIFLISLTASILFAIYSTKLIQSEDVDDNYKSIYFFVAMIFCLIISITSLAKLLLAFCLKQDVIAVRVKQLNKSIEFSAFKDMGTTQQHTDCMILH